VVINHNHGILVITLDNDSIRTSNDKFIQESQVSFFKFQEDHNPLDIPFGHEVNEINMEVKGPEDVDEGGLGSGRNSEGGNNGGGSQAGPLVSFGINETIIKQLYDIKLKESCPCHNKKN